jgi:hypothetical protein
MAKKYKISGKRSGPPPLRGPNPNVPPIKMRFGGGADMGKETGPETGRAGRDDKAIGDRMAQTQQAAINKNKSFQQESPVNKGINFGKAALTFAGSKLLNIPLGAVNLLSNIAKPQIANMKLGKNLNDYSPARPNFTPLGNDNNQKGLCPDGTMPPCPVVQASDGKAIRVRGTKAAIRGTGFKGVF